MSLNRKPILNLNIYYYLSVKNGDPLVVSSRVHIKYTPLIKNVIIDHRCQQCCIDSQYIYKHSADTVAPDIIVNGTDRRIDILEICSHNLYAIKFLLNHIYSYHGMNKTQMPIHIHNVNTTNTDSSSLLEIFEGTDLVLPDVTNDKGMFKLYDFIEHSNYRFRSIKQVSMKYGEYLLYDSCTKFLGQYIGTFVFAKILTQIAHLQYFKTNKLVVDDVNKVLVPTRARSLKCFSLGVLQLTKKTFILNACVKYINDILDIHRFSLEKLDIQQCEYISHSIWNDLCIRGVQWPVLKEVYLTTPEREIVSEPKNFYMMPLLTKLSIYDRKTRLVLQPEIRGICVTHNTLFYPTLEQLALLINRNRIYMRAARAWMIVCKFYLRRFNIPRDISLKIAHMVIETDTSDMGFKVPSLIIKQNHQKCQDEKKDMCDVVVCTTSVKLKLWNEIKDGKMRIDKLNFKRSNLQSALKPDEDRIGEKRKEIAKKEEEINTINAKLSKKRQEIDKIDDKKLKNDIVIERKLKALKTDK